MSASIWLCADVSVLDAGALVRRVDAALALVAREGVAPSQVTVWLRSLSTLDGGAALRCCRDLREVTLRTGVGLVIGERADLACLADADGVHVTTHGPSSRHVALYLSRMERRALWLSAAVHDASSAREAAHRCAVLLASPFEEVPSKGPPLGIAGLSSIVSAAPARATIALGGIDDAATARRAFAAGARGVAVRRGLLSSSWERSLVAVSRALVA